jgi:putative ABC transport system permease protein
VVLFREDIVIKNYLKTAIRNLWKKKSFSLINIVGLAIGISVSLLMLLYVLNEVTYDRFNENSENIYRIAHKVDAQGRILTTPRVPAPFGPALVVQFPEVLNTGRLRRTGGKIFSYEDKLFRESRIYYADPGIFDIFTIEVVRGNEKTFLDAPYSVVITEELAEKYFGREEPLGKILKCDNKDLYTVTGVVKKMPENSHFKFNVLASLSSLSRTFDDPRSWMNFNFFTYIELQEKAPLGELDQKYYSFLMDNMPEQIKQLDFKMELFLQPLRSIHLHSHLDDEMEPSGNVAYIRIMATIASFILLIACINFMNLSTALSAQRAKEVGMRKVLGADRKRLISQFLGESLLLCFISLCVALLLIRLLLPIFNQFVLKKLTFNPIQDLCMATGLFVITLLVGVISGAYPAFFLSSYMPIDVFRSRFKAGKVHHFSRNGLVTFQYFVSTALICSTLFVFSQLRYVKNYDLGFDKEQVMVMRLSRKLEGQHEAFKTEILRLPGVIRASCSSNFPVIGRSETYFAFEGFNQGQPQVLPYVEADEDYLDTIGIELASGRNFSKKFPGDRRAVILNETLVKQIGWENPIGKEVKMTDVIGEEQRFIQVPYTVVGVVRDFHFDSLREKIRGYLIKMPGEVGRIAVKIRSESASETIRSIEKIWKQMNPAYPFDYSFMDDSLDRMYRSEQRVGNILLSFSLIAIFVACLGLFGLASFTTEQRIKEIGIRKVLGASVPNVVVLLSKEFTKWVILANLIAWPVAYYAMNMWLKNFAYRIQLGLWVFILSGIIALGIALLTVSAKSIKAAITNPVNCLHYE